MQDIDLDNPEPKKVYSTAAAMYEHYGVDQNTQDFTGHALGLYRDDEWVTVHLGWLCMYGNREMSNRISDGVGFI